MKKLLLILFLLPYVISAQEKKNIELQDQWFKEAKIELNNNLSNAFSSFWFSYDILPKSQKGKESLRFFDSLKIVLRKKLINNLQGRWKLKIFRKSKSDRKHYERLGKFLYIKSDSIFFYKNRRNLNSHNASLFTKIEFCDLMNFFPSYSDIIHPGNEIWNYNVNSEKNKLTVLDFGKLDNDRKNRTGIISHPSGFTYNRIK